MQSNDGTNLENIIKIIEGNLLSHGFNVETRQKVFNDEGIQIAEFDVVITGKIGSAPFRCLIECRDRPSEGPAPGNWIEQLVGRKSRFGFDKVMAVSTTGFTVGAKTEAERANIELRELKYLTYEDVAEWLPLYAPLINCTGNLIAVRFVIFPKEGDINEYDASKIRIPKDTPCIIFNDSKERKTVLQIWQKVINEGDRFKGITPNGPSKKTTIIQDIKECRNYTLDIDGKLFVVNRIEFDVELSVTNPKMPLVQAAEYKNQKNGETFVRLGRWVGKDTDTIKEITFFGVPKKKLNHK